MQIYKQGKCFFYANTVIIITIIIVSAFICINYISSFLGKYLLVILIAGVGIFMISLLRKDYKSTLILNDEKVIITSRGRKYDIYYYEIVSIQYQGVAHSLLADCLVLNCGQVGKIYIDAAYEEYMDLWRKIITNTQAKKPNIVVDDSVIKRLNKDNQNNQNNQGTVL